MFFIIVFSIWGLLLAHIFARFQGLFGLRKWKRLGFGLLIVLLGFSYIPARIILASGASETFGRVLTYASSILIGFTTILWTCLIIFEVGALLTWIVTRRRLRKWPAQSRVRAGWSLCAVAAVASLVAWISAHSTPDVTRLLVTAPVGAPFRFALVSDLHLGTISSIGQWRHTLEVVRDAEPDALLIPGDLVDDSTPRAHRQVALLREFFPSLPIYVTFGNHDVYSGVEAFERLCKEWDLQLMRQNGTKVIEGLTLAGIDDAALLTPSQGVEQILPELEGFSIVLSHRPVAAEALRERPLTLVVAGHTHGGQIPPMVFLVSIANGWFRSGHYAVGEADLYVSRGAGTWGPPLRLFSRPEMVLIDIEPGTSYGLDISAAHLTWVDWAKGILLFVFSVWAGLLLVAGVVWIIGACLSRREAPRNIRTIEATAEECRMWQVTQGAGTALDWPLVEYAQKTVARQMSHYGFWNAFDSPGRAFRRGMGYCWQRASALELILRQLGFEVRKVHAFLNRFPPREVEGESIPGHCLGHVWLRVTIDGVEKDVCPGDVDNAPGSLHFKSLTRVREWGPVIFLLTYLGVPVFNLFVGGGRILSRVLEAKRTN